MNSVKCIMLNCVKQGYYRAWTENTCMLVPCNYDNVQFCYEMCSALKGLHTKLIEITKIIVLLKLFLSKNACKNDSTAAASR